MTLSFARLITLDIKLHLKVTLSLQFTNISLCFTIFIFPYLLFIIYDGGESQVSYIVGLFLKIKN